jgi:hypothetical protein
MWSWTFEYLSYAEVVVTLFGTPRGIIDACFAFGVDCPLPEELLSLEDTENQTPNTTPNPLTLVLRNLPLEAEVHVDLLAEGSSFDFGRLLEQYGRRLQ